VFTNNCFTNLAGDFIELICSVSEVLVTVLVSKDVRE